MIEPAVPSLYDGMKTIANNLIKSLQFTEVTFGRVTAVNPLEITVNQKKVITENFIELTNNVRDHSIDITVSMTTEINTHKHGNGNDGQDTDNVDHNHDIKGRKKIILHYGLKVGERVLLIKAQDGKKYVVIDRVDDANTTGEWK